MGSVVVVRKVMSGARADELLRELAARVRAATDDSLENVWHFSFDDDYEIARAEVEQTLNAISDTWSVHLAIEPGDSSR